MPHLSCQKINNIEKVFSPAPQKKKQGCKEMGYREIYEV